MIYWQLFTAFLRIGFFAFGGGVAALPLIEKEIVETFHWLTRSQFLELVTISELTPGPIAINSATFVGYRIAGVGGSLVATFSFCLPAVLLVTLLSHFLFRYRDEPSVHGFIKGLRPAVISLMVLAGLSLAQKGMEDWFALVVGVVSFFLVSRRKIDPLLILLLSGGAGILFYR
ncbi:MAG: chromate transporter [Atribacterota bacterium]